jgi:hypothetical protein
MVQNGDELTEVEVKPITSGTVVKPMSGTDSRPVG